MEKLSQHSQIRQMESMSSDRDVSVRQLMHCLAVVFIRGSTRLHWAKETILHLLGFSCRKSLEAKLTSVLVGRIQRVHSACR